MREIHSCLALCLGYGGACIYLKIRHLFSGPGVYCEWKRQWSAHLSRLSLRAVTLPDSMRGMSSDCDRR